MSIPKADRRESYVYILFRQDGRPCYVGKGIKDRWLRHERYPQNPHLAAIIAKAGGSIPKVKIREGLTDAEACETEMAFIAAIGRKCNGGPLVNMTDGGDGLKGHTHTKSPEARRRIGDALRGKKKTPEHVEAMRQCQIGKPSPKKGTVLPDAVKEKMSAYNKANGIKPPSRKGSISSPESNRKRSEALKAYWAKRASENASAAIQQVMQLQPDIA